MVESILKYSLTAAVMEKGNRFTIAALNLLI
jgi:hypothetical protein